MSKKQIYTTFLKYSPTAKQTAGTSTKLQYSHRRIS